MTDEERRAIGEQVAIAQGAAIYQGCAIVGALAERGLVDPLKVAAWADFFAENQGRGNDLPPSVREGVAAGVAEFAKVLRAVARKPPGSGEVRQ